MLEFCGGWMNIKQNKDSAMIISLLFFIEANFVSMRSRGVIEYEQAICILCNFFPSIGKERTIFI